MMADEQGWSAQVGTKVAQRSRDKWLGNGPPDGAAGLPAAR